MPIFTCMQMWRVAIPAPLHTSYFFDGVMSNNNAHLHKQKSSFGKAVNLMLLHMPCHSFFFEGHVPACCQCQGAMCGHVRRSPRCSCTGSRRVWRGRSGGIRRWASEWLTASRRRPCASGTMRRWCSWCCCPASPTSSGPSCTTPRRAPALSLCSFAGVLSCGGMHCTSVHSLIRLNESSLLAETP